MNNLVSGETLFDMYLMDKSHPTMDDVLKSYIKRNGAPPNPMLALVHNKEEVVPLPDGVTLVVKVEKFVLPKHVLLQVEKKEDENE